jgi:hypothetical protein
MCNIPDTAVSIKTEGDQISFALGNDLDKPGFTGLVVTIKGLQQRVYKVVSAIGHQLQEGEAAINYMGAVNPNSIDALFSDGSMGIVRLANTPEGYFGAVSASLTGAINGTDASGNVVGNFEYPIPKNVSLR